VIALINERDELHTKACMLADRFDRSNLITTEAILIEIGNALARGYKSESIEVIGTLVQDPNVSIVSVDSILFQKAFNLYARLRDKSWGLTDCVSFVVMKESGTIDALTCDRHFIQAGFRALMLDDHDESF
jgi:predicted nucleic acid-binding protein